MSQIERFKGYIFHEERESLEQIQGRLEDVEQRAMDIAEVLPRSLTLSQEDEDRQQELIATLREPISASIRDTVESDPESFANALFPVLGPLIRKAVGEAMRSLAERLNRTVEHSFSLQGIKWRWESIRTGTPLLDIILRDTLVYRVEQIFLVERQSGLLTAHMQSEDIDIEQDSDAVSAMLTAIQDFVRDSFGAYEQNDLNTVQVGGRTVWVLYGPRYMLASVFFGEPDYGLRPDFHAANEALHRLLGSENEHPPGVAVAGVNKQTAAQIENILSPLLTSDSRLGKSVPGKSDSGESISGYPSNNESLKRFAKLFAVIGIALLLLFVWHKFNDYQRQKRIDELIRILSDAPGVVVLGTTDFADRISIKMLKDPSVKLSTDLLANTGLSETNVSFDIEAFQSSDEQVLLEKIRVFLKAPNSVSLEWQDGILRFSGSASQEWTERIIGLPFTWLGIEHVDYSDIEIIETP